MKTLITAAGLFLCLYGFGQSGQNKEAILNISLAYSPAIIHLTRNGSPLDSTSTRNVTSLIYTNPKDGLYKVYTSGPGKAIELKDSIVVKRVKRLVLNISSAGPCLYDHPKNYVPTCPFNHTDDIIPIVYGLVVVREGGHVIDSSDEKVRSGGCVISDCDPKFYCKKHKVEF